MWLVRPWFSPAEPERVEPVPAEGRPGDASADAAPSAAERRRARKRRSARASAEQGEGGGEGGRGLDRDGGDEGGAAGRARGAASTAATPSIASSIARPSLWAPPTTWTRTRGLRATKAAARSGVDAARRREAGDEQRRGRARRAAASAFSDGDGRADREPGERVGRQGEERPVGARRSGPGRRGRRPGRPGAARGRADVGVEAVDDPEPGVVDVAVDVVGEQDRRQGEAGDEQRRSPPRPAARPSRGAATRTPR